MTHLFLRLVMIIYKTFMSKNRLSLMRSMHKLAKNQASPIED